MTAMICTPAAPLDPAALAGLLSRVRACIPRLALGQMIAAVLILLAASAALHADERLPLQDWIPDVLAMPSDAEVLTDRSIGSTVRMFSIATAADVDALFATWQDSLSGGGYPATAAEGDELEQSIEFSGPGIANAKIILAPTTDDGRSVIEFDATLD